MLTTTRLFIYKVFVNNFIYFYSFTFASPIRFSRRYYIVTSPKLYTNSHPLMNLTRQLNFYTPKHKIIFAQTKINLNKFCI